MTIIHSITYKQIEDLENINEVVSLQGDIWGHDVATPLPQLVASIHHGGIIIGAFTEEELIGFCYGFPGFKNGRFYLISHMAAIRPEYQNTGIGFQLKLKQREWALSYGYQKMVWTYDPLEVRNGFFNLSKLGAYSRTYLSAYYGEMPDKLNKGLPSDRLLIEWDIGSNRVEKAINGQWNMDRILDYQILLQTEGEYPCRVVGKIDETQNGYLISVPHHIQSMKITNLDAARAWRYAIREVLSEALLMGFILTGVKKERDSIYHYYILENKTLEDLNE
jgi:predicted GNAT superfamily acetyltransferase